MAASKQDAGVGRGGDPDYTEHLFAGQDPYLQKGSSLYVRVRGAWRTAPPAAPSPAFGGSPRLGRGVPRRKWGRATSPSGGPIPAFGGYFPMNGEEPPPH